MKKNVYFCMLFMRRLYFVVILMILGGCSPFAKLLKSTDRAAKYKAAINYYNDGKYDFAIELLDQLRDAYRLTDSIQEIMLYSGKSYIGRGEYDYAQFIFEDYIENYPTGRYAEECAYLGTECSFKTLFSYELDQSGANETKEKIQIFVNKYPGSAYVENCNKMLDKIRENLQTKEYKKTLQYYTIGDYRAAVISAQNTLNMYPDIQNAESLHYLMPKAQFEYSKNSVITKQAERYTECIGLCKDYLRLYSKGNYTAEVNQFMKSSEEAIIKIKVNQ